MFYWLTLTFIQLKWALMQKWQQECTHIGHLWIHCSVNCHLWLMDHAKITVYHRFLNSLQQLVKAETIFISWIFHSRDLIHWHCTVPFLWLLGLQICNNSTICKHGPRLCYDADYWHFLNSLHEIVNRYNFPALCNNKFSLTTNIWRSK